MDDTMSGHSKSKMHMTIDDGELRIIRKGLADLKARLLVERWPSGPNSTSNIDLRIINELQGILGTPDSARIEEA